MEISYEIKNLIRTCRESITALRAAKDMVSNPDQRDIGIQILHLVTHNLRRCTDRAVPDLSDVAEEYLMPKENLHLEFGQHDEDNAYMNYNVPDGKQLNSDELADIEDALRKMSEETVRDMNGYIGIDEDDPSAWVVLEGTTLYDEKGNELPLDVHGILPQVRTVQVSLVRHL